jgi:hypothetical protein
MKNLLAVILLLPTMAMAQAGAAKCLPMMDTQTHLATEMWSSISANGVCVRWWCIQRDKGLRQINTYCGLWSEIPKVGGRVDTIRKASDPLKSLNDAGKRFPIKDLFSPEFNELRAEIDGQ